MSSNVASAFRSVARTALLICAFLASGCHIYTLVDNPSPNSSVRVRVPVRTAVADPNAPPETASVEGKVIASGDTVVLEVSTRREIGAFREVVMYDTLRLTHGDLTSIEVREFSVFRSLALGIAVTTGAAALTVKALGDEGGKAGDDAGGDGSRGFTVSLTSVVGWVGSLLGAR